MLFSDIAGQESLKQKLRDTVKNHRVAHAQLFFGKEGAGKLPLAIAYAQFINCQDNEKFHINDSCGQCSSCHKFQRLIHPDLHFVFPVAAGDSGKKAPISAAYMDKWREMLLECGGYISLVEWFDKIGIERKQAFINVEECNQILQTLSYTSYEAEYKVMIIWMVERLNYAAAPKLLKIIEEPPEKTIFLLISHQHEQVLTTILSRLLPVKVPAVDREALASFLMQKYHIDSALAYQYALLADGNVTEAIGLATQTTAAGQMMERFKKWMRSCYAFNINELVKFSDEAAKESREKLKSFFQFSLMIFRQSLLYHFSDEFLTRIRPEERDFYRKFSALLDQESIMVIAEELNKAIFHIERNVHGGIVMFDLSLRLVQLFHRKKK